MSLFQQLVGFFAGEGTDKKVDEEEHPCLPRVVLLLEAATYDDDFAQVEREKIKWLLVHRYGIEKDDVAPLLELAAEKSQTATDLFELTRELSKLLSIQDRTELMYEIWQVILADGHIHKNEELFARKMQKLLRLDHSAWIRARLRAKEDL